MSRLDKLIEKLCPDGVEYRALKEIALMKRGTSITKKNVNEGSYPVVSGGREPAYYCAMFNRQGETITVAGSGAGAGYVQYWDTPIFVCDAFSVKGTSLISTKFLYYLLTNKQEAIYSTKKGGGVPHVHISDIENFRIPVPPLEVQAEIVRILDSFTELEKELEKELELRRKQYEYYRDLLLNFKDVHAGGTNAYSVPWLADMLRRLCPDGVEYKTLGEVAVKISDGMHNLPKGIREFGKYPILSAQNINKGMIFTETSKWVNREIFEIENRRTNVQKGDVLLTIVGAIGRTAVVEGELQALFQRSICVIKPDIKLINSRYIAYCLDSTDIQNYMTSNAHGAAQKGLYLKQVSEIKLPVPPLAVQRRIVDILERFDALCNDLTSGLPAEIALRRKQYEYYRDKLLSFKELKAS